MMGYLEKKFDEQIAKLSPKEQGFFKGVKKWMFQIYNCILKPVLLAFALFWIFGRVKTAVGLEEAIFIQLTVVILLLRMIASRLV